MFGKGSLNLEYTLSIFPRNEQKKKKKKKKKWFVYAEMKLLSSEIPLERL